MILSSCETLKEIKTDRCLTNSPITFKKNQDYSGFDDRTIKDNRKINSNYCCNCMNENPICQKPNIIKYCKEIKK